MLSDCFQRREFGGDWRFGNFSAHRHRLAPAYDADVTSYTAFVPYDVDGGTTGTASDDVITITTTPSGYHRWNCQNNAGQGFRRLHAANHQVELEVGRNVITVTVEAADVVTTKTYTITVTRATETGSDDTSLSALMVGGESVSGVADFNGADDRGGLHN